MHLADIDWREGVVRFRVESRGPECALKSEMDVRRENAGGRRLFRVHPGVVDADLVDFGSIPHPIGSNSPVSGAARSSAGA